MAALDSAGSSSSGLGMLSPRVLDASAGLLFRYGLMSGNPGEERSIYTKYMRTLATLLLAAAMSASGATTVKGWISDSSCGASNFGKSAESRECARNCLKNGAKPVLVTLADKKVLKLAGTFDATQHIDHPVEVVGDLKGDTLTVTGIKKAN